jgi:hypothetical protein
VPLNAKFDQFLPHLDERQRRSLLGAEARALGHGGIRRVDRAAGAREGTVSRGVSELDSDQEPLGRVRREGGGRKRLTDLDPGLRTALLALVEPETRGDPMPPLRWTTKSTRNLARELTAQGHRVSTDSVAALLRQEGFSLQANAKTLEGKQHSDRDAQFRYLNEQVKAPHTEQPSDSAGESQSKSNPTPVRGRGVPSNTALRSDLRSHAGPGRAAQGAADRDGLGDLPLAPVHRRRRALLTRLWAVVRGWSVLSLRVGRRR